MVTIKDVAKHANVSSATVSRVINGANNVSPSIKEKVELSIKTLGYFPNFAARSLVTQRSGSIAVLMRNLHSPFHSALIKGIEDGASTTNKNVIFCSLGESQESRDRYIQFLTNGTSDAIILYGSMISDQPIIEYLYSVNFPFLLIENNFQSLPVNQILIDNYDGAKKAIEYLFLNGHTKIAHFMGNPNKKVNLDRFNGYTDAMLSFGLSIEDEYIKNIFSDKSLAKKYALEIFDIPVENRPTAIFCSDDKIASKTIEAILNAGYNVPDDISVVGFDNQLNYESNYTGPKITSVKQPLYEIGKTGINALINILDKVQKTPYIETFKTELVINDTVAKINK